MSSDMLGAAQKKNRTDPVSRWKKGKNQKYSQSNQSHYLIMHFLWWL